MDDTWVYQARHPQLCKVARDVVALKAKQDVIFVTARQVKGRVELSLENSRIRPCFLLLCFSAATYVIQHSSDIAFFRCRPRDGSRVVPLVYLSCSCCRLSARTFASYYRPPPHLITTNIPSGEAFPSYQHSSAKPIPSHRYAILPFLTPPRKHQRRW